MLLYISLLLFVILLGLGIYKQKQIPECISSIYYNIGYWFTILLGLACIILIPYILDVTPETFLFSSFLCCASLIFVACAPLYRETFTDKVHSISAVISAIFAVIWTICINPWCLIVLLIGLIGLIFDKHRNTWWWELSCFIMIYVCLLI